jgi:hypothetical protein
MVLRTYTANGGERDIIQAEAVCEEGTGVSRIT